MFSTRSTRNTSGAQRNIWCMTRAIRRPSVTRLLFGKQRPSPSAKTLYSMNVFPRNSKLKANPYAARPLHSEDSRQLGRDHRTDFQSAGKYAQALCGIGRRSSALHPDSPAEASGEEKRHPPRSHRSAEESVSPERRLVHSLRRERRGVGRERQERTEGEPNLRAHSARAYRARISKNRVPCPGSGIEKSEILISKS